MTDSAHNTQWQVTRDDGATLLISLQFHNDEAGRRSFDLTCGWEQKNSSTNLLALPQSLRLIATALKEADPSLEKGPDAGNALTSFASHVTQPLSSSRTAAEIKHALENELKYLYDNKVVSVAPAANASVAASVAEPVTADEIFKAGMQLRRDMVEQVQQLIAGFKGRGFIDEARARTLINEGFKKQVAAEKLV